MGFRVHRVVDVGLSMSETARLLRCSASPTSRNQEFLSGFRV